MWLSVLVAFSGHLREGFVVAVRLVGRLLSTYCLTGQTQRVLPTLPRNIASSCVRYLSIVRGLRAHNVRPGVSSLDSALGLPHPNIAHAMGRVRRGKCLEGRMSTRSNHIACLFLARDKRTLSRGCGASCFSRLLPCLSDVSRRSTTYAVRALRGFCTVVHREGSSLRGQWSQFCPEPRFTGTHFFRTTRSKYTNTTNHLQHDEPSNDKTL